MLTTTPSTTFADVILPLPLDALFTYSVPRELEGQVARGMRVLVPFGRSKSYVGIVSRLHNIKPEGYQVKPISLLMDEKPILLESQLRQWEWIADYYMSPIGEVMKAALPAETNGRNRYKGCLPAVQIPIPSKTSKLVMCSVSDITNRITTTTTALKQFNGNVLTLITTAAELSCFPYTDC